jgi:hypothetical protein
MITLFGSGYAKDKMFEILRIIKDDPRDYPIELLVEGIQAMAFILTPELRGKTIDWIDSLTSSKAPP